MSVLYAHVPRRWRCATCGASGPDGGFVAGREHLDECPERAEAEVRGFVRVWQFVGLTREVGWFPRFGHHLARWTLFPQHEEAA